MIRALKTESINPDTVLYACSAYFGASLDDVVNPRCRRAHAVVSRRWAVLMLRRYLGWSFTRCGQILNRSHNALSEQNRKLELELMNGKHADICNALVSAIGPMPDVVPVVGNTKRQPMRLHGVIKPSRVVPAYRTKTRQQRKSYGFGTYEWGPTPLSDITRCLSRPRKMYQPKWEGNDKPGDREIQVLLNKRASAHITARIPTLYFDGDELKSTRTDGLKARAEG